MALSAQQVISSHGRFKHVIYGRGPTHYNTKKYTLQPRLCGDNLDSQETSSEESFYPLTWQILTIKPEQGPSKSLLPPPRR